MDLLIKGMEMPCACVFCELYDGDLYWCRGAKKEVPYSPEDKRAKFCPLIPVPPHGRLIEAEPIMKYITDGLNSGEFGYDQIKVLTEIQYAPTIIEAEEGGKT